MRITGAFCRLQRARGYRGLPERSIRELSVRPAARVQAQSSKEVWRPRRTPRVSAAQLRTPLLVRTKLRRSASPAAWGLGSCLWFVPASPHPLKTATPCLSCRLPLVTLGVNYELNSERYELVAKAGSNQGHPVWKVGLRNLLHVKCAFLHATQTTGTAAPSDPTGSQQGRRHAANQRC